MRVGPQTHKLLSLHSWWPMSDHCRFSYAESTWNSIKKSNLLEKYEELIQTLAE